MAVERTFVDGKMVITFQNGRTREVTVEQLQERLTNLPTVYANRSTRIGKRITNMTTKADGMEAGEQKTKLQERLVAMQTRLDNLPTVEDRQAVLQGWIDEAAATA